MSKLVLTDDHKDKIIDMSQTYMWDYNLSFNGDNISYKHKENTDKVGESYWLDHVIFHLAKKVLKKNDTELMLFRNMCLVELSGATSHSHPINYLYERWKLQQRYLKQKELVNN